MYGLLTVYFTGLYYIHNLYLLGYMSPLTFYGGWTCCKHYHAFMPSKHETFTQCCFNVGPRSPTLARHWNSIKWMPRVCWMLYTWSDTFISGNKRNDNQWWQPIIGKTLARKLARVWSFSGHSKCPDVSCIWSICKLFYVFNLAPKYFTSMNSNGFFQVLVIWT